MWRWLPDQGGDATLDAQLARLAGPALVAGALVPLDEMMQAALVGQMSGTASLAALGVCSSVYLLVFKVFNFLETATSPRVARAGDDNAKISRIAADALFTATVIGVAIAIAMQCGSKQLLIWLETSSEVATQCLPYLQVRALAAPFELCIMASQGTLRGSRDLTTPAASNLLSSILTCGIGLVLMAWFDLGLLGLGVGRLVASIASCTLLLASLLRTGRLRGHDLCRTPHAAAYASYARSAGALFVRTLLIKTFFTAVAIEAGKLATASAAAHVIARQTASLFSIALDSYAAAAQALIATHMGRDPALVRAIGVRAHRAAFLLSAVMVVLLLLGSSYFVRLFTADASVHAALQTLMPLFSLLQLLGPPAYVFDGIFLGAADFNYMAMAMGVSVAAGFAALHGLRSLAGPSLGATDALAVLWLSWGVHVTARSLCFARRFFSAHGPFATGRLDGSHRAAAGAAEFDSLDSEPQSPSTPETAKAETGPKRRRQSLHRTCKQGVLEGSMQSRSALHRQLTRIALVG